MASEAELHERRAYQFAATIAFPSGLTRLDFGFCLIFGIEERFFFFWSSRPIIAIVGELEFKRYLDGWTLRRGQFRHFENINFQCSLSYRSLGSSSVAIITCTSGI